MRMMVKCPRHGSAVGMAEGDDVIVITGGCGCRSAPYGAGDAQTGGCPEHGRSEVILVEPVEGSPRRAGVLLACGCQGDLWVFGSLSLFRRKEAVL